MTLREVRGILRSYKIIPLWFTFDRGDLKDFLRSLTHEKGKEFPFFFWTDVYKFEISKLIFKRRTLIVIVLINLGTMYMSMIGNTFSFSGETIIVVSFYS